MRTTVDIDEHLLREAKKTAAARGVTLASVIEDSLREAFARRPSASERRPIKFHTVAGTGTFPGVDISNSAELLELMDQDRNAADRR
jgi:hypothetical protein